MNYLDRLQQKKVFSISDVEKLVGNEHTAKSLLQRYIQKGYIDRARRDLYVALDLASKTPIADRYEIACGLDDSSFISHHSALEYHGIANQVFNEVTVTSFRRISGFSYQGITYGTRVSNLDVGIFNPFGDPLVRVTDIERTIVDCIDNIELAGGLEEIMEGLKLIPNINESKLLTYLKKYNVIFLWQKTGLLLRSLSGRITVSEEFFNICKSHIHDKKQILVKGPDNIYYPEWKLYAPKGLIDINKDGGEELV